MRKYEDQMLNEMRMNGDTVADAVVKSLFAHRYNLLIQEDYNAYKYNNESVPNDFPDVLKQYFESLQKLAHSFDAKIAEEASIFFTKNAKALMAMLGLLSLPYCYAAADGAQVLAASKRIVDNPEKRLLETSEFVLDVCSPDALGSSGRGIVSIGKVRLMHAAIRYHLMQSGTWQMSYGLPINQEDMAGTNLAFSLIAIRGMRKLGLSVKPDESNAYLLHWNNIGKLGGILPSLLPSNTKDAFLLERRIAQRNFRESEHGKQLTKALVNYVSSNAASIPLFSTESLMGYLLGDGVAQMIGVSTSEVQNSIFTSAKGIVGVSSYFKMGKNELMEVKELMRNQRNNSALLPFRLLNSLAD